VSGGSSTWRGFAAAAALVGVLAAVWLAPAGGAESRGIFGNDPHGRLVSCNFSPDTGTLLVTIRQERLRIRLPRGLPDRIRRQIRESISVLVGGSATIQRRGDQIAVLQGQDFLYGEGAESAPLPCGGGATVDQVEEIRVRRGKNARSADLLLDLGFGVLGPGATDEGDGSSEIELTADLGPGYLFVRMTRGADPVASSDQGGTKAINLNAGEAVADADLIVGRRTEVAVDGAGAGDQLTATGVPGGPFTPFGEVPIALGGGQGSDTLIGGEGSQGLYGLAGRDRIDAGAGPDFVMARERAPDNVDCGPGRDVVVISSKPDRIRDCELRLSVRELFEVEREVEEVPADEPVAAGRTKARVARAASAWRRFRVVTWLSDRGHHRR
jgi:hypothetical protein